MTPLEQAEKDLADAQTAVEQARAATKAAMDAESQARDAWALAQRRYYEISIRAELEDE